MFVAINGIRVMFVTGGSQLLEAWLLVEGVEKGSRGDSLPAEMRKEIERANEQMGVGAFESIEAQRDAVLAALESVDINASN